jgi:hypothetical protein
MNASYYTVQAPKPQEYEGYPGDDLAMLVKMLTWLAIEKIIGRGGFSETQRGLSSFVYR